MRYISHLRQLPLPFVLLLILIASLPFSYLPVLQLGTINSVHVDIAWLYIIAVATTVSALPDLWRAKKTLLSVSAWRLLACWLVFTTLSLVWTANLTRGLITVGFSWLLFALATTVMLYWPLIRREKKAVLTVAGISVLVATLFAVWQLVGDALDVSTTFTLLPASYQVGTFGFARPTAFALEPQFFASILLAPWLFTLYKTLRSKNWQYTLCFVLLTVVIGFTLSRGAFLAMLVAGLVIFCTTGSRTQRVRVASFGLGALLAALLVLMTVASLATKDSAYQTLDTTLNQISLGIVDLPSDTDTEFAKESSSSRIEAAALAVNIWSSQPTSLLIGTGIGGFGQAANSFSDGHYPTHLVANNYYAEMLAELGLVGASLFAAFIGTITVQLWRARQWLILAIFIGYLVQWSFFSGNANVIHIWVFFGLLGGVLLGKKNIHYS